MKNHLNTPAENTANETSFHGIIIKTTINQLKSILGEIDEFGGDKTNVLWVRINSEGNVFTIYDWKEYRAIDENEEIDFHIGSHSQLNSFTAKQDILNELKNL